MGKSDSESPGASFPQLGWGGGVSLTASCPRDGQEGRGLARLHYSPPGAPSLFLFLLSLPLLCYLPSSTTMMPSRRWAYVSNRWSPFPIDEREQNRKYWRVSPVVKVSIILWNFFQLCVCIVCDGSQCKLYLWVWGFFPFFGGGTQIWIHL